MVRARSYLTLTTACRSTQDQLLTYRIDMVSMARRVDNQSQHVSRRLQYACQPVVGLIWNLIRHGSVYWSQVPWHKERKRHIDSHKRDSGMSGRRMEAELHAIYWSWCRSRRRRGGAVIVDPGNGLADPSRHSAPFCITRHHAPTSANV